MTAQTEYLHSGDTRRRWMKVYDVASRVEREGPCLVRQVTIRAPGPVTEEAYIDVERTAGKEWDARHATLHFQGNSYAVWQPEYDLVLMLRDKIVVSCASPRSVDILVEFA